MGPPHSKDDKQVPGIVNKQSSKTTKAKKRHTKEEEKPVEPQYPVVHVALAGPWGSGKTTFFRLFGELDQDILPETVARVYPLSKDPGKHVKFSLKDTGGSENFAVMTSDYYRHVHVFIIMFDLSNLKSLERAKEDQVMVSRYGECFSCFLVGNKSDLREEREIFDEARLYAENVGSSYFEISAKTQKNVDRLWDTIVHEYEAYLQRVLSKTGN